MALYAFTLLGDLDREAAAAGSVIAIVIGAVLAVVVAFGTAWLVITLTDLLKQ